MGRLIKGPWAFGATDDQDLMPPSDDLEYVAFDVETTGFNKNDRIVEIALVTFKNGELLEEWSTLLNPQRDVGKSNIHGITASMVSTAPLFEEVVNDIFRIINGRVLVAHQFSFDARMLAQELNRLDVDGDLGKAPLTEKQKYLLGIFNVDYVEFYVYRYANGYTEQVFNNIANWKELDENKF